MVDERPSLATESFAALLDSLHAVPTTLAEFIAGLSPDQLHFKDTDDEFSVLENICHLRDLELQGYRLRIHRIMSESDPQLEDFDGARVAAESNYNQQPPDLALAVFKLARRENVHTLRRLTNQELDRAGVLAGVGRITLRRLAEMMCEHDAAHLDDLRVLRQRLERRLP
jgi:DinB superfamily